MLLYLNCDSNGVTYTKKEYLLEVAKRLNLPIASWTPQIGADAEYILNIEPYTFKKGKKWTGIWEIDLLLDRQAMNEEEWEQADKVYIAISSIPDRFNKFKDKTRLLFQACDPLIHKRLPSIKQEYDVVFQDHWVVLFITKEKEFITL